MGKTLENAKDTVTTRVEEVKHDVETTLKEKVHDLDDAKNSLMGKLNLNISNGEKTVETVRDNVVKTADEQTNKLTDTLEHSKEMVTDLATGATGSAALHRNDTETDSLRTSTPEPEIERALANTKSNNGDGDDDDDDNPPTPKPTFSELENLSHELLEQQKEHIDEHMDVNDPGLASNDPAKKAMTVMMMAADTKKDPTNSANMTIDTTSNSSAMQ